MTEQKPKEKIRRVLVDIRCFLTRRDRSEAGQPVPDGAAKGRNGETRCPGLSLLVVRPVVEN
jgi:hypothetical protein